MPERLGTSALERVARGLCRSFSRIVSRFAIAMCVLWTLVHRLSKLDILGACLSGAGLKSGMLDVGFKLFAPQEELCISSSSQISMLRMEFTARLSPILLPRLLWGFFCLFVFLMCLMCRSNLASFGIFFTENCFVCSCGFGVFKGQGKVRESSYITMLNCKLCDWYF